VGGEGAGGYVQDMSVDLGRVGIWSSIRLWRDEAENKEAAAELDELGYGALWLGGAHGDLALVEALLDASSRLVLATGIVNVWVYDAADVAAARARVVAAHPDRFLLGLGIGHAVSTEAAGMRYEKPYEKLVAYLDALDASPHPVPMDEMALAALGPRVLRLAADRTAGAHPYLVPPEHTQRAREVMGPDALLAPDQKVVLETDPDRARAVARQGLAIYLRLPNYTNNLKRLGFTDEDLVEPGSDRLVDALIVWGDVDTIVGRVRAHLDAGADHVCIQALSDTPGMLPRAAWRALAPALRGL
jgi:probable F420-dependent oxidoreductase